MIPVSRPPVIKHVLGLAALLVGICRSRGVHDELQVCRHRHFLERADVCAARITRWNQTEESFRGSSENTESLPCYFPAAALTYAPGHHQKMCPGMQPGRVLSQDMGTF